LAFSVCIKRFCCQRGCCCCLLERTGFTFSVCIKRFCCQRGCCCLFERTGSPCDLSVFELVTDVEWRLDASVVPSDVLTGAISGTLSGCCGSGKARCHTHGRARVREPDGDAGHRGRRPPPGGRRHRTNVAARGHRRTNLEVGGLRQPNHVVGGLRRAVLGSSGWKTSAWGSSRGPRSSPNKPRASVL
jgi:hypothetical protein